MSVKVFTVAVTDVPTAGTAIQVGAAGSLTNLAVSSVTIQAVAANTNGIWVGDSSVLGSTNRGIRLTAGQTITLDAGNIEEGEEFILGDIYVDTDTNGNDFSFVYVKRR